MATVLRQGSIARLTTAARTDVIGKVTAVLGNGYLEVRVPRWTPDGYHWFFRGRRDEWERSTVAAMEEAAAKRYR